MPFHQIQIQFESSVKEFSKIKQGQLEQPLCSYVASYYFTAVSFFTERIELVLQCELMDEAF